ncbi:putative quinol monooxygenase [Caulobacter endophyticus]|uniref:Antibiotic biosynthesis monooxygenase n=1 Tax=Caulobacter endophyticus TaxID=2172652 RepID=A0A2T9JXW9_9CAUL|nr:putative quinol monooxygenase [Caulobacter endophyticus]PVM88588.1 antibiotic biosynthesis monooxygenase [Caulobacter endophyticus]
MTAPLQVIAVAAAAEGREAELRAAQLRLVQETRREPGCLRYELNQSLDDPRILIFTETWESEAHWRAHMQGAAIQRFQASGAGQMIADFSLFRATRLE